jgi:hypothetical protein
LRVQETIIAAVVATALASYFVGRARQVSVHLFEDNIPLDRHTEFVSTVPDNNIYAIGLSCLDIHEGTYYLSIHCGESAQRFRAVIIEVPPGKHATRCAAWPVLGPE